MRRRRSSSWIYARIEPGVPMAPAPVIIGFIPDHYAVLSANGESAAIVIMGDVVTNYRIRCPYFKSIHRPPSPSLRSIKAGTPTATDVACYGRRVCARQTLYKDSAARSRPAYLVASDETIAPRDRNSNALTNVVNDTPMAGPDPGGRGDKDRPSWWPCSGHRPPNIVPFDRPVVTAEGGDSPLPAFDHGAVCHSPVVAPAADGRADRWGVVPHVNRQVFHAPVVPGTKQKIARRHPGDLQDGGSAPHAHQMNIRRYV